MRLIRKLMITLVAVASAFMLVPATAAQAYPHAFVFCWWTGQWPYPWKCVEVPILVLEPEWPPGGCTVCDLAIDPWEEIDPRIAEQFIEPYAKGLVLHAESTLTEDPKESLALRDQSVQAFMQSAEVLNEYQVELQFDRIGGLLQEKNEFFEDDNDLLVSAGKNFVEGERLMQQAALGKDADAIVEEAMAHFDEAYADLTTFYGG